MKKLLYTLLAVFMFVQNIKAQVSTADFQFLEDLYNNTNGAGWTNNSGWNLAGGASSVTNAWYGVTVSGGRLTGINLYNNGLVGFIPPSISGADALVNIYLGSNALSGSIPDLSALSNLQFLELSANQLSGAFPANLSNTVRVIRLNNNQFTGSLPATLPSALEQLIINDNLFSGTISASTFNVLSNLQHLRLISNNFTGEVPDLSITTLLYLELNNNNFNDNNGINLSGCTNLQWVYLGYNQLSGSLPVVPSSLQVLDLSDNQYTGNIPAAYTTLANLQQLILRGNQLSGSIPDFSGAISLQFLYLQENNLTGAIPDFSTTNILYLYLNNNNLTGTIPASLWESSTITDIDLSNNQLSGNLIVTTWGADRVYINLSGNLLTGTVPEDFKNTNNLNLANNQFTGFAPNFTSSMSVVFLDASFNRMQFGDLEGLFGILGNSGMSYAPQAIIGTNDTLSITAGSPVNLSFSVTGTPSRISYQWFRNGTPITGATANTYSFTASASTIGSYVCRAYHQDLDSLILERNSTFVRANLTVSGKVTTSVATNVAGIEVTLLEQRIGLPFLKVANTTTNANGDYTFVNQAELGKSYTILAKPQSEAGDLSTYLGGKIFWQEADIITPNGNINNANITLALNPTATEGFIEVTGEIIEEEEINDGQRNVLRGKKVGGTGVSMNQSTLDERILMRTGNYILKAFTRTDTAGKFKFEYLPRGKYFINVDFAGIPMDSTSAVKLDLNVVDKLDLKGLVYNDRIVMVISTATNVAPEIGLQDLQVYPNPADKKLFVKMTNNQIRSVEFSLCNTQGKSVRTWQPQLLSQEAIELPLAELEKGVYILQIKDTQTQRQFSPIRIAVSK